ncbi:type II toxin-antitoxin system RelE/ParE family toxin [Mucilaginibacter gossypii]|uniref:type II toxin-antitoxin system RelE/ParE family toxin n=1 Tax=Mucilaginibacter gossypii TaxID=551996 RepID=UPI000DCB92DA|nr:MULTISPECIES: type II toxin-antitoxin system RelE/ParE family toxin [Mucilaginibacter]QTE34809.1 type II toxin-antitoxin system RelE/ParE family toxin [Mucilaginibacter gossypii]RAV49577.1 addiction module toxin RelE [Mucilaginibacter rubeus]
MANKVVLTAFFLKKAKRLVKKFATLSKSLAHLEQELIKNPKLGDNYGSNIYKVRVADESKGKGKSGGFRIITYIIEETNTSTDIYLITIFDKSEEASIDKNDIKKIIKSEGL